MKGFRKLGEPLFSQGLTQRLALGTRSVAGGDTTAPTVAITCAQTSPSSATTLNFTITFSEPVTGFEVGDFVITNGIKGALGGSGAVYTCDVTPTGMSVVTANVAAGVAIDGAGNENTAATQVSITSTAPFSDAFTRADGAIGSIWTGATWTISSNAALNTPTVGAEVLANPGFEGTYDDESGGGGGTVNVAPNWDKGAVETDGTDTLNESATAHGGSKSQLITVNAAGEGVYTTATLPAAWYQLSAWVNITSGSAGINDYADVYAHARTSITGSWVQLLASGLFLAASNFYVRATSAGANFLVDDASAKAITASTLFATLPSVGLTNVIAQAVLPISPNGTYHSAGVVVNLDSISNPLYYVVALLVYTAGAVRAKLYKCVNGAFAEVITGTVTFNAAHNIKVVRSGNDYSLYYGAVGSETQVGATTAIAGMTGTIHGILGTHSTIKVDNYTLTANP